MKSVSGKHLCRVLESLGWEEKRVNRSHHKYAKQGSPVRISVPVHGSKHLKRGLPRHLMRMADLQETDLYACHLIPERPAMKKPDSLDSEIREEYDFSKGIRGKYASRFAEGCNVVVLEPDVAARFPDSRAVNKTLRELVEVGQPDTD